MSRHICVSKFLCSVEGIVVCRYVCMYACIQNWELRNVLLGTLWYVVLRFGGVLEIVA